MHSILWLLLFAPPCLALLTWLMTRGWKFIVMGNRSTSRVTAWQKYDFWIILLIMYAVMFTAAVVEGKL